MAAATIVYFLYILSGFMSSTSGGEFISVASFPTQEACEATRTSFATQLKAAKSNDKLAVCISSTDLDNFAEKVATPYIK